MDNIRGYARNLIDLTPPFEHLVIENLLHEPREVLQAVAQELERQQALIRMVNTCSRN